jgi:hypothetical protein
MVKNKMEVWEEARNKYKERYPHQFKLFWNKTILSIILILILGIFLGLITSSIITINLWRWWKLLLIIITYLIWIFYYKIWIYIWFIEWYEIWWDITENKRIKYINSNTNKKEKN